MSTQTIDQQTTPEVGTSAPRRARFTRPRFAVTGTLMATALTLVTVGSVTSSPVELVIGVVIGVTASFVLASHEMGERKAS